MLIRRLDAATDRAIVAALFAAAADYILTERGTPPDPRVTDAFFTDCPPGTDPAASHRAGLFDDSGLIGLADLAFGYPEADAAFLGLMILAPEARGRGYGRRFLADLEATARARGCRRIFLAVLEANPRGRAFWEATGFSTDLTNRPVTLGRTTQMARRMVKTL